MYSFEEIPIGSLFTNNNPHVKTKYLRIKTSENNFKIVDENCPEKGLEYTNCIVDPLCKEFVLIN